MKTFWTVCAAVLSGAMLLAGGCTSVQSTQKFNALDLASGNEKAVCQSYVEIPGLFFLGIPLVVGSAKGDGGITCFRYNLTAENAVYLLTREAKSRGAARMLNVQVSSTHNHLLLPGFTYSTIQASGTGVTDRRTAMRQAADEFDAQ